MATARLLNGALAMRFLAATTGAGAPPGYNAFVPNPDGKGGTYLEGTFELTITDATGIYANGKYDEFCFCNISRDQFPGPPANPS